MSTPEKTVAGEALFAALLVVGGLMLAGARDLAMPELGFHPAWIPVLVFAARYGMRGLLWASVTSWGLVVASNVLTHRGLGGIEARFARSLDLLVLGTAVVVAWIAILHEGRTNRALAKVAAAAETQQQTDDTVKELHDALAYLRARNDRIEMSLALWRDLAGRLEHGDPGEAARAALELCAIRAGAAAGVVQMQAGDEWQTLAHRGVWSPAGEQPRELAKDRTVATAIAARKPMPASDVTGSNGEEADVAIPIVHEAGGPVLGVIALRGVSPGRLRAADMSDLVVIAEWLAPALALALWAARPRTSMGLTAGVVG